MVQIDQQKLSRRVSFAYYFEASSSFFTAVAIKLDYFLALRAIFKLHLPSVLRKSTKF